LKGSDNVVAYADSWNEAYDEPGEQISEAAARRRHEAGESYAALVKDGERRIAVASDLGHGVVTVFFLDPKSRWTTKYVFTERDGGGLWLQQAHTREWLDDRRYRFESTTIRDDGRMYAERGVYGDREKEVAEQRLDPATLTFLDEPVPEFGDYRSITRFEREAAPQA